MFDEGQKLPSAYHRTKFESEKIAREESHGAVARLPPGDRRRPLADRRDGQDRRALLLLQGDPEAAPLRCPSGCRSSAPSWATRTSSRSTSSPRAMDHIAHQPGPRRPGLPPHRTHARSAPARCSTRSPRPPTRPQLAMRIDKRIIDALPKGVALDADEAAAAQGRAPHDARRLRHPRRRSSSTSGCTAAVRHARHRARADGLGHRGARRWTSYADKLWDYWERNLDPDLFRTARSRAPSTARRS